MGSTLPDAVGRNQFPLPELPSSFRLSASSAVRIEPQGNRFTVMRTGQVPVRAPGKKVGVFELFCRSTPAAERRFDQSSVDQGHIHVTTTFARLSVEFPRR